MSRTKKEYRTYSRENYDRFIKENNISEEVLTYSKYKKNLEVCNWMYVEYALSTGEKVFLPYGFGPLAVNRKMLKRYKEYKGKKFVNLRINWKKSKEAGKRIYHTNEHSDGFNYKWAWFPGDAKLTLADLYVFRPCRYASRAIAKYVNKPDSQYKQMYLDWSRPKV